MHGKIDRNHNEIVAALESMGATVLDLSQVGKGCPDVLVGYQKNNTLMEIKFDAQSKYTPQQEKFNREWNGQRARVHDEYEAFRAMGMSEKQISQYIGI